MRLRQRLEFLERHFPRWRCPGGNHRRGLIALVTVTALPDGSTEESALPEPCTLCGEIAERILGITERVVTRESLLGEQHGNSTS
jgi:tRNA U54 and U55 pseudouridine synthase Pus10